MAMKKSDSEQNESKTEQGTPMGNTPKIEDSVSNVELLKIIKDLQDKTNQLEAQLKNPSTNTSTSNSDIKALAESIAGLNRKVDEIDYNRGIDESQIPEDDILTREEWVTFCVPKAGYPLTCDYRNGYIVKLPYGKQLIWFEFIHMNKAQAGKHTVTTPIATYVCKSRKEMEWIRNHSLFGTLIFESTKAAMNTDAERAMRLATVVGILKSKELPEIVADSRQFNLPFIKDNVEQMRHNLAMALVNREHDNYQTQEKERAEQAWKDQQLIAGLK